MNALRSYYLTTYLGLGAILPLLALAMQARGFRPTQYGWLMALLPLSRLLAPPLWGALADKRLGTSLLLRVNTACSAAAMLVLSQARSLGLTVAAFAVWAISSSSLMPLAEASTYRLLGEHAASFGYVRVFGSIGFAVSATVLGVIGMDAEIARPFVFAGVGYAAASLVALRFPDTHVLARAPLLLAVRAMAKKPDVLWLWVGSTLYYAAHGAYDAYFGPHVAAISGIGSGVVSYAWALSVVCEVLMLFVVPPLLRRYSSDAMLLAAAAVSALRWFLLARVTSPAHVWALAPLHAVTFGLFYLAFVHANQAGAPPELRATVQGLAAACLGLGMIVATLLGGWVFERLGGRVLFDLAAALAVLSGLAYLARTWTAGRAARALAAEMGQS